MPGQVHKIGRQVLELVVPQEPGVRQAQDAFRDLFYARLLPVLERVLDEMVPPDKFIRLERLELNLGSTGWDLDPEPLEVQLEAKLRQQMEQILSSVEVDEAQPLGEFDAGDADWNLLLHYLVHGEVPEWLSPADFKPDAQLVRMLRGADTKQIALLRKVMALPVVLLRVAWTMPEATRRLALERLLQARALTVQQIHADLDQMHRRQSLLPMDASMFGYRLWESSLSMVTLLPETAISTTDILPIYLQSLLPQPIFRPRDRVWLLMRSIAAVPAGELAAETVQAVVDMAALAGIETGLPVITAKPVDEPDSGELISKESKEREPEIFQSTADTASEMEQLQAEASQPSTELSPISMEEKASVIEPLTPASEDQSPRLEETTSEHLLAQPESVESTISKESSASIVSEPLDLTEGISPPPLFEQQLPEEALERPHLPESKEQSSPPAIHEPLTTDPRTPLEVETKDKSPDSQTIPETQAQELEAPVREEATLESKEEVSASERVEQRDEIRDLALEKSETTEEESADSKDLESLHSPEAEEKSLKEPTESLESVGMDKPAAEELSSQETPHLQPVLDSDQEDARTSKAVEALPEAQQPIQKSTEESAETPIEKVAPPMESSPESVSTPAAGEQPQDAPETLLRSAEEESIADRFRRFREQWAQNPESLIPRTQTEPLHIPWRQNDPKHGMGVLYAGLVIAWPYIGPLFKRLEWLEKREFVSPEAQFAAVHLLRYVATGTLGEVQDHELGFCKVMAGLHPTDPVPTEMPLTEAQCAAADEMVDAVIANWGAVKRTSRAGLRQTFLQRAGNIRSDENGWIVHLERETMDILLDRIPWGYSTIRLGWQSRMIFVQW